MTQDTCGTCLKPKANLVCEVCMQATCKKCAQFVSEDLFSFLENQPECVSHQIYCSQCFNKNVAPELEAYNTAMDAAKNVQVFNKSHVREVRFFSKKQDLVRVVDCADHDEAILRLAFMAAKSGFDSIMETEVSSKKVITNGYQRLVWSATARPTNAQKS